MANIQNELNNIKTALYGKDVRNSIHDAIKTCYDDASVNNDNANMEVKLARGTHNTLNDRLCEVDEKQNSLSSQLEYNANRIDNIYINIDDFEKLEHETDDTGRIQRAINYCKENNKIAYSSKRDYIISSTVFINDSVNLSNARFICNNLLVGLHVGGDNILENKNIHLPSVVCNNEIYQGTGVIIQNLYTCRVYFELIKGFNVGLHITANNNNGCVYNQFTLKYNLNNKTQLLLSMLDETGWVNQNTFSGGRLYNSYSMLDKFENNDIKYIHLKGDTNRAINNNTFINTCVETLKGYKIYCEHATYNMFINCRYEGDSKDIVYIKSKDNIIMNGYGVETLNIIDDDGKNMLFCNNKLVIKTANPEGYLRITNTSSDNNPGISTYYNNGNKATTIGSNNGLEVHGSGNAYASVKVSSNGVSFGSGTAALKQRLRNYGDNLRLENGPLEIVTGQIILGSYYVWFDESGIMRCKKGKPTSLTDGNKIGQQS